MMKLLCILLAGSGALWGAVKCDDLKAGAFGDQVKIRSATLVAAKGDMPEYCDVRGVIWPEAQLALKLPTSGTTVSRWWATVERRA